jgi:HSP20 family protein
MNRNVSLIRRMPGALATRVELMQVIVAPLADIYETDHAFVVKLDMPGASKEGVSLTVNSDRLEIRAVVGPIHSDESGVILNEIGRKTYYRAFNLGDGIDRTQVGATFEDGVLTIALTKTEAITPRTIPVR